MMTHKHEDGLTCRDWTITVMNTTRSQQKNSLQYGPSTNDMKSNRNQSG